MGMEDQLFKNILSDKEMLVEFINIFLPKLRSYNIKPENIKIENTRFTDLAYGDKESDLLFKIKYDEREMYLFLLIEHQSSVDYLMQFRILEYMIRIWREYIKSFKKESRTKGFKLIPIIPIVFYTGKRKWTAENWFMKKVENWEMFSEYVPSFKYEIIDLSQLEEERLLRIKNALGLLLTLNKSETERIIETLKEIKKELETLPETEKAKFKEYVGIVINVLTNKTGIDKKELEIYENEEVEGMFENFIRTVEEAIKESKEKAMIEGRKEGLEQGLQQGLHSAKVEDVIKLLKRKFKEKDIEKLRNKIENLDIDDLDYIIDNIFEISFDELKKYLNKRMN
ncbi:hypothetical protein XO10_02345 [Marinitoga sp. 1135]|uniref:Rpn family recombination-promoting nuclease/putative transposase n=1 Tax=unclassified Marinitoga TaxID=2640159 RepID=UPI001586EA29|nr:MULTISPECIES: Rpn family recombination-promoting nuclease/putative transposase [unclassified Marinitoga]NUU95132.1 hypothetical protein [Marinitoga sp. 1135]NUU97064.1 hypothetical protein [Marinitoga sp. 1138]